MAGSAGEITSRNNVSVIGARLAAWLSLRPGGAAKSSRRSTAKAGRPMASSQS